MRKWLLWAHMYAGLFCFGFLIVFSVSAIFFNHKLIQSNQKGINWERAISTAPRGDAIGWATAVSNELGIAGRVFPGATGSGGNLDFKVGRPGRLYDIHVKGGSAKVTEFRLGWMAALCGMHALRANSNSTILNLWAWYSGACALLLAGMVATGVYVWAVRRRERVVGWSVVAIATAASLALGFYIRFKG